MSLRTSPISRNLRMNARFLGLEVEDLFIITAIAIFFLVVLQFVMPRAQVMKIPLNWFMFLLTIVIGVPFLSAFKYGKPRGYMTDFALWYLRPKRYDCHARDTTLTRPYLIEVGEEKESKAAQKKEQVKRGK